MRRVKPPPRGEYLDAMFSCPLIHDLAADLTDLNWRKRRLPLAMHLAWGALARMCGSANRLDAELHDRYLWDSIVDRYQTGAETHAAGIRIARHNVAPLTSDTYRHVRDRLVDDEHLTVLLESFTQHSLRIANQIGLLLPNGAGSRTRPHPTRTIYGDGTIVRPLYRPRTDGTGRQDHDAAQHGRHDGQIWGNDLVIISTRGPEIHRRAILAIGRVHDVGHEAETAIGLIREVLAVAGDGVQAVCYDGALRGVHISTLMDELGLIVVNKVHAERRDGDVRTYRRVPLGQWEHTVGGRTCRHTLVAHAGAVHDTVLTDTGELVLSRPLERKQIRRYPRGRSGGWRFSLGVVVACPKQPFVAWVSPHPQPNEDGYGRPDQLRLIHENDQYFQTLYGLRNDAEAINSNYKRTLTADRASARGWRRQVLDLLSWGILTNTLAWHRHAPHNTEPASLASPRSTNHGATRLDHPT